MNTPDNHNPSNSIASLIKRHMPAMFTPQGDATENTDKEKRLTLDAMDEYFGGRTQGRAHCYAPGSSGDENREHIKQLAAADGKPRHLVNVYKMDKRGDSMVRKGDRVTLSYLIARRGTGIKGAGTPVITAQVQARNLYIHSGAGLAEWNYSGSDIPGQVMVEEEPGNTKPDTVEE